LMDTLTSNGGQGFIPNDTSPVELASRERENKDSA
jgi:hypothetical protein